jgi:ribosomal protein S21
MYVTLREGETQEALLKRFQRSVQNSGLLREVKAKRFFISNGEKARIAARKSAARHRRRARKEAGLESPATAPKRKGRGGGAPRPAPSA